MLLGSLRFLICLAMFSLTLPALAQTEVEVWSGTLTVQSLLGSSAFGCSNSVSSKNCSTSTILSDDDFNHADTDYAIENISLVIPGRLSLRLDTNLASATQSLTFHVGSSSFAFEDADTKNSNSRSWNSTGLSWSSGSTVSLRLTVLNNIPTASDNTVSTDEDTAYTFAASNFNFSDSDSGDTLSSVKIVTLPASGKGTLAVSGTAVTANQVVTAANIANLTYTPPANANGTGYASFTFKVNDGTSESADSFTMTIDVTAANDAPTAFRNTVTTAEGTPYAFRASDFNFADTDIGDTLASVKITTLPGSGKGSLELDGTAIASSDLPQTVTRAQLDDFYLRYDPPASGTGTGFASFTFKVNDGTDDSYLAYTMTIDVTAASSPAPSTDHEYWSATLTPRNLGSGRRGCDNSLTGTSECSNSATLSEDDFPHLHRSYTVDFFQLGTTDLRVVFDTYVRSRAYNTRYSSAFLSDLTLRIGNNVVLALSDASIFSQDDDHVTLRWPRTTAIANAIQAGSTVALSITGPEPCSVATPRLSGVKVEGAGSGRFRLSWDRLPTGVESVKFSTGLGVNSNPNHWVHEQRPDGGCQTRETNNQTFWEHATQTSTAGQSFTIPAGESPTTATFPCSTVEHATHPNVRYRQDFDYRDPPHLYLLIRARAVFSDGRFEPWTYPVYFRGCGIDPGRQMTSRFLNPDEPHDGSTPFDAKLELSLEPASGFSYLVFQGDRHRGRTSVLQVTNGTVERARRDGADQNRKWLITIVPTSDEAVTITLPATTDCTDVNAICTADGAMLSEAVTKVVPGPATEEGETQTQTETETGTQAKPSALTVAYTSSPPTEHDGESEFSFAFAFSENLHSDYSYKTMRDHSLTVMQGETRLTPYVRRKTPGGGNNQAWIVTVTPGGNGDIAIALPATPDCDAAGALCTGDERGLSAALPARVVQGPPGLSVADARVEEAAGATVDFAVTLSRAATSVVTVDYATSDGTATAGSDYTETSGTLTFAAGETEKTVSVPVLNDYHDEGEETFTLTLSNPSGGNAYLADATAEGAIENSDPMPQAWLARFGRTLAGQVVDMIAERFEGGAGTQVTVGGERLPLPGGAMPAGEDPRYSLEAPDFGEDAPRIHAMTGRALLLGSSFDLGSGGTGGPGWAAWGRVATGGFDAEEDSVRMSGSVTSAFLGADIADGPWLAGLALSLSDAEGDYTHVETELGGDVESSLAAVYPYARFRVNQRLQVWGLAGYGTGELSLHTENETYRPDISMRMLALGARGEVLTPDTADGFSLALKSDVFWVRMNSEEVRASPGNLAASEADATRLRLTLQGSRSFDAGGGTLTPRLEAGLRHDGGDAETGSGFEVGASLRYDAGRISAEGSVRTLLAHEAEGYGEWGAAGTIRINPDSSGRGFSMALAPTWGASSSGAQRLWSLADPRGLAPEGGFEADRRLDARLGYGLPLLSGRYTATPKLKLGLGETGREMTLGWRLAEARRSGLVFGLDIEGARRERERTEPEHRMGVGLGWRREGAAAETGAFEVRFEGSLAAANDEGSAEQRVGVKLGARW